MNSRPASHVPSGLPQAVADRIREKQDASWCFVSTGGGAFYLDEARAKSMLAEHGGSLFAPVAGSVPSRGTKRRFGRGAT